MYIDIFSRLVTFIFVHVLLLKGKKMELTDKQQHFLDYLEKQVAEDGRAPSLRQAAGELGVSHNAIAQLFLQLERKGVIERDGRYSRKIRFCRRIEPDKGGQAGSQIKKIPIVGQITAGLPMYAQQEWDGSIVVDPQLFPGEHLFCLRVQGQSMCNAGILDRDLVVCEPRQYAENGEIIVALLHGEEATVKRFQLAVDHIKLLPENPDFSPVSYQFNEIMVQGKVVGVIRDKVGL